MNASKIKQFRIQVINIKLLSNERKGDDAYKEIIKKIHETKVSISVRGGKDAILRTLFTNTFEKKDDVIYGQFSKYTVIDGKDWLNLETLEKEDIEIPANRFPNLVESEYVFIPAAHRFAIVVTTAINVNAVVEFLKGAIKKVINKGEDFEVIMEQSEDIFNDIKNADEIYKLLINISYTNADIGSAAFQFMDNQLKESNIGRITLDASPDHNNTINPNSEFIMGALEVAQSNGFVKATIGENGRKRIIETKVHPLIIRLKSEISTQRKVIFDAVMNLFRKKERDV